MIFDYFIIGGQFKYNYEASIIDKVGRLVNINESQIILVENSNPAFGIYSEKIQEKLGMPVVDLEFHGGMLIVSK